MLYDYEVKCHEGGIVGRYMHYKIRIRNWWSEFIRPRQRPDWQRFTYERDSYIVIMKLDENDSSIPPTLYKVVATPEDLIIRRSWLLPWRRYYFINVGREAVNSPYHALYSVERDVVADEYEAGKFISELLKGLWNKQEQLWFAPAGLVSSNTLGAQVVCDEQVNKDPIDQSKLKVEMSEEDLEGRLNISEKELIGQFRKMEFYRNDE